MNNKEQVLQSLRTLKPEIAKRFKVKEIGLFGSFLRSEQNPASDIDLVVEFEEKADLFDLVALGQFLEERLGRKVDLGTKGSLRKEIRRQVLKEMVSI
ncbi:MAG: nucleotidyltransferase family protein [Thermodesulfobacteriota bacterium]